MKKILSVFTVIIMSFVITACDESGTSTSSQADNYAAETEATPDRTTLPKADDFSENNTISDDTSDSSSILIAYFSRTDENYGVGVIEKGNTEIIAEMIADKTGGDLFHIETVNPYPADYDECTNAAKKEKSDNARPELKAAVENIEQYDTIFLGYPIWYGDMPMAVYTFIESYDWNGKTVIPFNTHEGSGAASTISSVTSKCEGATIENNLTIQGQTAQNDRDEAEEEVNKWLGEIGY